MWRQWRERQQWRIIGEESRKLRRRKPASKQSIAAYHQYHQLIGKAAAIEERNGVIAKRGGNIVSMAKIMKRWRKSVWRNGNESAGGWR
jgi:hypothetical protein